MMGDLFIGLCYILSTTSPSSEARGVRGGVASPPLRGPGQRLRTFFFGPYIRWVDLPMVLCMDFEHGFGHDGFFPWYFVDLVKGTIVMF